MTSSEPTIFLELRRLLDDVFETHSLMEFQELVDSYRSLIPDDISILFGIREQKWFGDSSDDKEYLLFPFLSFYISNKKAYFFKSGGRKEIVKHIEHCKSQSYYSFRSRKCYFFADAPTEFDHEKLFNLTKRIFITYYHNCGNRSHFLRSVSSRFVKEFWNEVDVYSWNNLQKYIYEKIGISVKIFLQKDEIYFERDFSPKDVLLPCETINDEFRPQDTGQFFEKNPDLSNIFYSDQFKNDLLNSIQRNNQSFGSWSGIKYLVSSFQKQYFNHFHQEEIRGFHKTPYIICVYSSREELSLEKVFFSDTLIENYIATVHEVERDELLDDIDDVCAAYEIDLSETPVYTRDELIDEYEQLLHQIFRNQSIYELDADVTVRLFNPFSRSLDLLYSSRGHSAASDVADSLDLVTDKDYASVVSFNKASSVDVWHKKKVFNEISKKKMLGLDLTDEINAQVEKSDYLRNSFGEKGNSILAYQISSHDVIIGVLEITSEDRGSLALASQLITKIARVIGDALRRLELANDRGWLTRMQFLHAARHKIERILDQVRQSLPEVADELQKILRSAAVSEDPDNFGDTSMDTVEGVTELIEKMCKLFPNLSEHEISLKFFPLLKLKKISIRNFYAIQEIIETLASNEKHSKFSLDHFEVFAGSKIKSDPIILISYRPEQWEEPKRKTYQICVSPISETDGTFHYGLFLLANQIRMIGGLALSANEGPSDKYNLCPFGLSFLLPESDLDV
ncbi:hypothetical protein [Roseibium album]|uniref:Uncharacterized protein n=1 Tax=Roseibium album TaxID=311410 RepID=A0A0M6ZPQ1_9HYPH|nr:hypothetical protein [Roseibium album]CTQ63403.1 hypothetical protein LA5094_06202 [Roseibium album]CTQ79475.1 hypothetical protein LA5096_06213 [Roseibium album]CTQ80990.1 hypothetical protein LA5095_06232 [Roseibium album]